MCTMENRWAVQLTCLWLLGKMIHHPCWVCCQAGNTLLLLAVHQHLHLAAATRPLHCTVLSVLYCAGLCCTVPCYAVLTRTTFQSTWLIHVHDTPPPPPPFPSCGSYMCMPPSPPPPSPPQCGSIMRMPPLPPMWLIDVHATTGLQARIGAAAVLSNHAAMTVGACTQYAWSGLQGLREHALLVALLCLVPAMSQMHRVPQI